MTELTDTQELSSETVAGAAASAATPGLLLVFAAGRPAATAVGLDSGRVEIGRLHPIFDERPDACVSRRHARVSFEAGQFLVADLGSRNGTAADGAPIATEAPGCAARVIRVGDSLLVPVSDVGPFQRLGLRVSGGRVEGPALQQVVRAAASAARLGPTLHITGESGAGKEGLARAFHAGGPCPSGPFQAVNCATIPEGVAERLLFGTKRGAYSGADADADGYIQAAHGGTLFLDEVAELGLSVQAKLLRVLETGEVLALGAARPRKVELRFCSATHRDLRAQVAAGKLREDLYFRIASPRVAAPPLRQRPEEIPWLLQAEVERTAPGLAIHVSLVESCLLRAWPGNVRELCAEVRSAAQAAVAEGAARVEAKHLGATAGLAFTAPVAPPEGGAHAMAAGPPAPPTRARLAGVLERRQGNVSAAARELGVHRTQLRRWMERHGLDARAFAPSAPRPPSWPAPPTRSAARRASCLTPGAAPTARPGPR
ncbi:sigma 54-interacting transcriptional regulator [Sorangium sp. So ce388]|uniref:sigma 54-interacting transcriptional regulator n=1 Tax=Sorangium sp. So ce388 TaxID=3133309 RepID=UPI003F5B4112